MALIVQIERRTIRKVIVDGIILRRELREEQLRKIGDPDIWVFKTLGHFAQLTLNFDHAVENQVGQHHERVFLHDHAGVREPFVENKAVLVNDVVEGDGDIAQGNHDVAANDMVL